MKTILVDAINTFVIKEVGIFNEMHQMLEEYPNKKIILTSANDEQVKMFKLDNMPYEIFTLKHEPEKTDPNYYKTMLSNFNLNAQDVIYFDHNKEAVESAKSVGIKTFHYNKDTKDLTTLKKFIDKEL